MPGYSGTPLAKKLGIKPGSNLYLLDAPETYSDLIAPIPEGVTIVDEMSKEVDLVHLFTKSKTELQKSLKSLLRKLKPDGVIWVSWPKKSAKVPTDITEDTIREVALPMGLVDIKVCAVDEVWSGLKLMIRKENRKG
jgi:hypothetical protein